MMIHAFCNVALSPVREDSHHDCLQISQILYGESAVVLRSINGFANISWLQNENGWVDERHLTLISDEEFATRETEVCTSNFENYQTVQGSYLLSIGSEMIRDRSSVNILQAKKEVEKIALQFLNVPYLLGGRSIFGVDASGFLQLVFKVNGIILPQSLEDMSEMGENLFFIGECEPGDVAFFSDGEGEMIHAGIMLSHNTIIHVDEKIKIETIDSTGIYSESRKKHTFLLRIIQRIL